MTGRFAAPLAAAMLCSAFGASAAGQDSDQVSMVLPRDADVVLALSAAPPHLREGAAIYVFTQDGYELAREGTNGFTCFNNRDAFFYGADALKPTCWDAAGADSYVPVMLDVGAALAAGAPRDRIAADIEAGFASGKYREPSRTGIAYMLAGDVRVDASGAVTERLFPGHIMIYAPNVTNADIGYDREAARADPTLPSVFVGGAGGAHLGYIIVATADSAAHAH